jgi:hypothetical protein
MSSISIAITDGSDRMSDLIKNVPEAPIPQSLRRGKMEFGFCKLIMARSLK